MQRIRGILKPFGELKSGDAFLHKGFLLMKMQPIIDRDGDTWNAVNTDNGKNYCFYNKKIVEAVRAIVRIEEENHENN